MNRVVKEQASFFSLVSVALCKAFVGVVLLVAGTANAAVSVSKGYFDTSGAAVTGVNQGDIVRITFTVLNSGGAITNGSLLDNLPAGMVVGPVPNVVYVGCGTPASNAVPGAGSFSFSGATVPAQAGPTPGRCEATVSIRIVGPTGVAPGTLSTLNNILAANTGFSGTDGASTVSNPQAVTASIQVSKLENLTVAKSFGASPIRMGETTSLSIVIANPNGGSPVGLVGPVVENLPSNVVAVGLPTLACAGGIPSSATTLTTSVSGSDIILPAGTTIAGGGNCTITWQVRAVASDGANSVAGTNTISPNIPNDRGLTSPTASASINAESPLIAAKSFSPNPVRANQPVALSITLQNRSASALSGVNFSDPFPSGMTSIGSASTSAGCSPAGSITVAAGSISGTGIGIAANSSCVVTVSVQANDDGAFPNTIAAPGYTSANPAVGGPRTSGSAGDTLTVFDQVTARKLSRSPINGAQNAGTVAPGNRMTYRVIIDNYSLVTLNNVAITDLLPSTGSNQVVFLTNPAPIFSGCTGTVSSLNGASSANFTGISIPAAPAGSPNPSTCTVEFTVQIPNAWPVGTPITNTIPNASITQNGTPFLQGPNPSITNPTTNRIVQTKSVSASPIFQGTTAVVTLTLINNNFAPVTGTSIVDSPIFGSTAAREVQIASPANVSTTCGGTPSFSAVPGSTAFSASGLTVPTDGSCQVTFTVLGVTPGAYTNTIPASGVSGTVDSGLGPVIIAPAAAATAPLAIQPVISATKTFSTPTVGNNNGTVRVNINLQNLGLTGLTGVNVTDPLPTGLVVGNPSNALSTCAGPIAITAVPGSASVSLTGGQIQPGGTCTLQFDARTNGAGGATITNTIPAGQIAADGQIVTTTPVSASVNTVPPTASNVSKTFSPTALASAGDTSRLTITITNLSSSVRLTNLGVVDNLPSGMILAPNPNAVTTCNGSLVVATGGAPSVSLVGGTLAPSASCTVQVSVSLFSSLAATNTIPAGAVTNDQNATNASDFSANLNTAATIGIDKSFNPISIPSGGRSLLRIRIINTQSVSLSNISVTDLLPGGLSIASPANASTTCTDGSVTTTANQVSLNGAKLVGASGSGASICEVSVFVTAAATGSYVNVIPAGALTATDSAGSPVTNASDANSTVQVQSPVTIAKSFANPLRNIGEINRLTITLTNPNIIDLTNANLTDNLPTGVFVATVPNTATTCPSSAPATATVTAGANTTSVLLTGATIRASASCTVSVDVFSNITGTFTNVIPASALTTLQGVTNTAPATAAFTVAVPPTLGKQFSPVQIGSGGNTKLRIVLGNSNAVAISTTANLIDTLPQTPGALTIGTPAIDSVTADPLPRCTGASASTGGTTITIASGTSIPAGGCVVIANVTGTVDGIYNNVIPASALQTSAGVNPTPATASVLISSTLSAIAGSVYTDANNDGIRNPTDAPIAGTLIELLNSSGVVVATANTDSSGNYTFLGIDPGTYSVREPAQPTATLNGQTTAGTGGTANGTATAPSVAPSQISGIQVAGGQSAINNNFGEINPSNIAGRVFADVNNDGIQQPGDAPISGVSITLSGTNDLGQTVNVTATTAPDGTYSFPGLRPGTYRVTEGAQPAGTANGLTVAGTTGGTTTTPATAPSSISAIVLGAGVNSTGNNFAEIPTNRTLAGRVFVDDNNNTFFNGPDAGVTGLTVTLTGTDVNGNTISASLPTDSNGNYSFAGLPAGTYSVSYSPVGIPAITAPVRSIAGSTGGTGANSGAGILSITGISLVSGSSSANNFTVVPQKIDVVKAAGLPRQVTPSTFEVPYIVVVGNNGAVPATNVQVADNLRNTYPNSSTITIVPGSFSGNGTGSAAVCAPPSGLPGTPFNGTTSANLIAGNFTLLTGEKCVVSFVALVDFGATAIPFVSQNNTAFASTATSANAGPSFNAGTGAFASNPANTLATDISVNQPVPPGAAGAVPSTIPTLPTTANSDPLAGVPTPVNFSGQILDVIKNAGIPLQVPASVASAIRFEVPYSILVRNTGSVTISNVQAVDSLVAAYSAGSPSVSIKTGSFTVSNAAPNAAVCAPSAGYNGTNSIAMLTGSFNLTAGQQCTISFIATVEYPNFAAVPTALNDNIAFAMSSLTPNPTGGTISGSGSAVLFTPTASTTPLYVDVSSGNTAAMGAGPAALTVYSTTGGTSGTTGPVTTPTATQGTQQMPATAGADNLNPPVTRVGFAPQRIDVIKSVGVARQINPFTYEFPYLVVVKNTASSPLPNTQVMENLLRTFNPSGAANITISVAAPLVSSAFDAPATAAPTCTPAATAFNGQTQQALLAGTDTLAPGQKCAIQFVVTVSWTSPANLPSAAQNNQVYASGSLVAQTPGSAALPVVPNNPALPVVYSANALTTDASTNVVPVNQNGLTPGIAPSLADLPANPIVSATAPSPTPVSVTATKLDVVKALASPPVVVDGRTFDVPYVITVKNTSGITAYNVQINDYLPSTFASPASNLPSLTNGAGIGGASNGVIGASIITLTRTAGNCTASTTFNGSASNGLLSGVDSILPGASCTIGFTVRVQYASVGDVPNGVAQNNSAYASSTAATSGQNSGYTFTSPTNPNPTVPANVVTNDASTNGLTPPSSANGDVASPTPVQLNSGPDLVVRKSHSPAVFTENNLGTYTIIASNRGFLPTSGVYTIVDTLPAGMTVASVPTGTGWTCTTTVIGSNTATCQSSQVVAPGAGVSIDNPNPITLTVRVAPGACAAPDGTGNCLGAASLVNNVAISGGGEVQVAFFTGNNSFADPTPIQQSGSVSGNVWRDVNHDRIFNTGDTPVAGFGIEVINSAGVVVGTATTDSAGNYRVNGLIPGPGYGVRFKDLVTGAYYGRPVSKDPAGGNDPSAAPTNGVVNSGAINGIVIPSGNGVRINQNLPLDPNGVVYDSVTRLPVPGATVEFLDAAGNLVPGSCLVGGINLIVTSTAPGSVPGGYSFFLLNPAPAGCPGAADYSIRITPPSNYVNSTVIPAQSGRLIPPSGCSNGAAGGVCTVQAQETAPVGAQPTPYYLSFRLNPALGPDVVNNHIPLDPVVLQKLVISKVGDRSIAELGDSVKYTIQVKRVDTGLGIMPSVQIIDTLPAGFTYIPGTMTVDTGTGPRAIADAAVGINGRGPVLTIIIPNANLRGASANTLTVTYRVRLGVGSVQGNGVNRAQATPPRANCAATPGVCSNEATYGIKVTNGVFTNEACVIGKVYLSCNNNHVQDGEELGIPGVRLYLNDGTALVSDSEGKYSFCGLRPTTWVLKVDPTTMPRGSRLTTTSSRNVGDAGSLFLDLKAGELHRADFAEGSCSNPVVEQVKARRTQGEVRSIESETKKNAPLTFKSKAATAPQQSTDSANQPVVVPRVVAP